MKAAPHSMWSGTGPEPSGANARSVGWPHQRQGSVGPGSRGISPYSVGIRGVYIVRLDALAFERQFVDHLAPLWRALPEAVRGRFLVDPALVDHAMKRGIA